MSKQLGLQIGQMLKGLSEKVAAMEAAQAARDAQVGEFKAQSEVISRIDYATLARVQSLFDASNGADAVKALDDLSGQVASAADQSALEQHETRVAIGAAAKMIVDALDRNTAALRSGSDV